MASVWSQTYFESPRSIGSNRRAIRYTTKKAVKKITIIWNVTSMALNSSDMANLLFEAGYKRSTLLIQYTPFDEKPSKTVENRNNSSQK
jgi:hypothetical protein